jgi:hypothetical protein
MGVVLKQIRLAFLIGLGLLGWLAIFVIAIRVLNPFPDSYAAEQAFSEIQEGDTEQHLLSVFKEHGIVYTTEQQGATIHYMHDDGVFGVCIYYVRDGLVEWVTRD